MDSVVPTQLELLKDRIPYEERVFGDTGMYEEVLQRLLDDSKYIALSLRFPYQDYSNINLPTKYNNWQIRCCIEIYQGIGTEGIKSYSENGLNWTRDSGYISHELREEIEPMVGYIMEVSEDVQSTE